MIPSTTIKEIEMPETQTKTDREEFLDDVIVTAIEGGIGYWSVCHSYKWKDQPAVTAVIQEWDEWEDKAIGDKITVDRALIRKGIKQVLSGEADVAASMVKIIAGANATNDGGDIDADAADVIVQAAIFGTLTYG
jgi:hypothetical protein